MSIVFRKIEYVVRPQNPYNMDALPELNMSHKSISVTRTTTPFRTNHLVHAKIFIPELIYILL